MIIVVISDTHLPKKGKGLPRTLVDDLKRADCIIHAGDWQTRSVYEELRAFARVEGVFGNVDDDVIKQQLEQKLILQFGKFTFGVVHGDGKGKTTERRAIDAFKHEEVDMIIFGHSHIPVLKKEGSTILFNPGSPTDKRRQKQYSYGMVTIHAEKFEVEHVFFDDKSI